jgi:hypothetical protein
MIIQNCTDNIVDPACSRWHEQFQPEFTGFVFPTPSVDVDFTTMTRVRFTSTLVMTYLTESDTTKHLPMRPSTISGGNVTVVPFTPGPESTQKA